MGDAELIAGLINGDEAAFTALVEAHQDAILNVCYRFVGRRADAEDVAQEVFVEVLRSIADFEGRAQLSTWIHRIAVTRSLDFVRRRTRKKRLGHLKRVLGIGADREEGPAFEPAVTADPGAALEQHERAEILAAAVAALPENQRVAITLNQYEQMSYAEVAAVMGTTVSAVESLLVRAKKGLRKRLARYYDGYLT